MASPLQHLSIFISLTLTVTITLTLPSLLQSQQPYIGRFITLCNLKNNTNVSAFGYTCNGLQTSCKAYLTFRSHPPYNSVPSISTLLSIPSEQITQINSVTPNTIFDTNQIVLVPVNCSCSGSGNGQKYQAKTSYVVQNGDTYFTIANYTLQGLSSCGAIRVENPNLSDLFVGTNMSIPLRCACPTRNQTIAGVNYLLSYSVTWGNDVSRISTKFGVNYNQTLEANSLNSTSILYPFTTLLLPFQNPPKFSQFLSPPPPPPSSPTTPPANRSNSMKWVFGVVGFVLGALFALIVGGTIFRFCRVRVGSEDNRVKTSNENQEGILNDILAIIPRSMKIYTFDEIRVATGNFGSGHLIKGSVYKGMINGEVFAIKKMDGGDVTNEICLLSKINHSSLISLKGICLEDGHYYLVYEYATNGALSDWVVKNKGNSEKLLTWVTRVKVSFDIATGLNYIHNYTSPPYVHGDINSSNVLLDHEFRAKIANFSLTRSAQGHDGNFILTGHIVGTMGYMAPEFLENGLVSTKLDVYAFGVLLLEILSGKEGVELMHNGRLNLEGNAGENLLDPSLEGNYPYPRELAMLVMEIAVECISKDPMKRPRMDEISQSLYMILTKSMDWEKEQEVYMVTK